MRDRGLNLAPGRVSNRMNFLDSLDSFDFKFNNHGRSVDWPQPDPWSRSVPIYQVRTALWQIPTVVTSPYEEDGKREASMLATNALNNVQAQDRLRILEDQISDAAGHFAAMIPVKNAKVIDLFVSPEYLFAESDRTHFISEESKDLVVKGLKGLTERNPRLLLVPGTVAWKKPALRGGVAHLFKSDRGARAKKRRDAAAEVSAQNISARDSKRFDEARASGEQYFLGENTAFIVRNGKVVLKYHKRWNGGEVSPNDGNTFWVPGNREGFFSVDGLDFGLQICAEHAYPPDRMVDIQIVISASSSLNRSNGMTRPGGYLLHSDAVLVPQALRQDGEGYDPAVDSSRTTGSPLTAAQIQQRVTDSATHFPSKAIPSKNLTQTEVAEARAKAESTQLAGRVYYFNLIYQK